MTTKDEIPVFTADADANIWSSENKYDKRLDAIRGEKKLKIKVRSAYLDGKLEDMLGTDLQVWLSGTITGEQAQLCKVFHPLTMEVFKAFIVHGLDEHNFSTAYIVVQEDVQSTLAYFNKKLEK